MAALLARTRTHINDVVGMANGVFIMLDNDNRVAQIAQAFKRGDKTFVVALMQADGRFVQNVQHAHETSANLRSQANALGLAARKRRRATFERQIVEAHIDQELQARAHLFYDSRGNERLALVELQIAEELQRIGGRHIAHFVDILAANSHGENLGLQALSAA